MLELSLINFKKRGVAKRLYGDKGKGNWVLVISQSYGTLQDVGKVDPSGLGGPGLPWFAAERCQRGAGLCTSSRSISSDGIGEGSSICAEALQIPLAKRLGVLHA